MYESREFGRVQGATASVYMTLAAGIEAACGQTGRSQPTSVLARNAEYPYLCAMLVS